MIANAGAAYLRVHAINCTPIRLRDLSEGAIELAIETGVFPLLYAARDVVASPQR